MPVVSAHFHSLCDRRHAVQRLVAKHHERSTAWIKIFSLRDPASPGSAETLVRRGGEIEHALTAYRLSQ